ncbi:MAG TPA: DMT family transporter [Aquabacterium sp.]|uniref:DMT family transporter n=1 Tax=Aquabacterium sp. TaxID=1872578 RepID=UPI002E31A6EE|nr:DMT family transporter [Aquabacterium sp.]HEX5371570.1 DMT family transporter [Aquabacterium sp.]
MTVSTQLTLPGWLQGPRGRGLMMAALGAIAFSGKAIVAKLMYKLGADAISVVGLRMTMAFPLFLVMAWWAARQAAGAASLTRRQWWQVVGLGITGYYLASTLDFMGLQYISASLERAILYLNPTMVLILSVWWFRQRVTGMQWAAVGLAYAGVAVVWLHDWETAQWAVTRSHELSATEAVTWGSLLVLGSALSYAVYLVGSGRLVQQIGSLRLVGYASIVACGLCALQWLLVSVWTQGQVGSVSGLPWQAYALSALNASACTVLPVWLLMRGVQLLGASIASQVGMIGPLSTIWMAAWWLGEPVSPQLMLGTAAILAGIVLLTRAGSGVSAQPPTRART